MSIITLLSDLGHRDPYIAQIKTRILLESPDSKVLDLSHDIEKFNLTQAAYILRSLYFRFPKKTIHVLGLPPNDLKLGSYLIIRYKEQFFVGADNGFFSLITDDTPDMVVKVKDIVKTSFPTLEILIPLACKLAKGEMMEKLGVPYTDYLELKFPDPRIDDKSIVGNVIYIDDYGNLITNITKDDFLKAKQGRGFEIRFRSENVNKISEDYYSAGRGECVAIFNDDNKLELAIVEGDASRLLGMRFESQVRIKFN